MAWPIGGDDLLFKLKRGIGCNYFLIVGAYGLGDLPGMYVVIGLAFYLGLRHAVQNLIPAVDPQVTALEVFDKDDGGGIVEDRAHLRLAGAQRFLGVLARCDVLNVGDCAQLLSLGAADDRPVDQYPYDCPILPHVTLLDAVFVRPASEGGTQLGGARLAVVRVSHFVESKLEQLLLRITEHLTKLAVDPQVSAVRPDLRHAYSRQFEQLAELFLAPAQFLFHPAALGHIALRGDEVRYFAALI